MVSLLSADMPDKNRLCFCMHVCFSTSKKYCDRRMKVHSYSYQMHYLIILNAPVKLTSKHRIICYLHVIVNQLTGFQLRFEILHSLQSQEHAENYQNTKN